MLHFTWQLLKGCNFNFYYPSRTYRAIPYCTFFNFRAQKGRLAPTFIQNIRKSMKYLINYEITVFIHIFVKANVAKTTESNEWLCGVVSGKWKLWRAATKSCEIFTEKKWNWFYKFLSSLRSSSCCCRYLITWSKA